MMNWQLFFFNSEPCLAYPYILTGGFRKGREEKKLGVHFFIIITKVDYFSEVEIIFFLVRSKGMQWKEKTVRLWFCECELRCNQARRGNDDRTRFLPACPVKVRKITPEKVLPWIPFLRLCSFSLMRKLTTASAKGLKFLWYILVRNYLRSSSLW